MTRALLACLIILLSMGPCLASADDITSSLQRAAEQYVQERLLAELPINGARHFVSAEPLDRHLQPPDCAAALQPHMARSTAQDAIVTVSLYCPDSKPWTEYVQVRIEVETTMLVLRRSLARRSRVEPRDVELQTRRMPGTSASFLSDADSLTGHRLRRSLKAGTALSAELLVADVIFRRGQQVTLLADRPLPIGATPPRS